MGKLSEGPVEDENEPENEGLLVSEKN